ncbi:hypothetical protein NDI56_16245 [Haloarcula sp. S1CR25-12]|uniref:HEAT repeat domain-containing protein n=1 Tax=Haloarcula saliterrae TaxID=2950534 RepID=A0ABU2FFA9_9EURY|nr:hypothetical protein [Haloarcula sp. S1CR25-12]MDS0260953.1 hypothetical protein [Haloarcula sp. S1CR25-12]
MSSRTPTEYVDRATDSTASEADRIEAIHALKTANECDELAALVRNHDIERQFRNEALEAMGTPRCDDTLQFLVDRDVLDPDMRSRAVEILDSTRK